MLCKLDLVFYCFMQPVVLTSIGVYGLDAWESHVLFIPLVPRNSFTAHFLQIAISHGSYTTYTVMLNICPAFTQEFVHVACTAFCFLLMLFSPASVVCTLTKFFKHAIKLLCHWLYKQADTRKCNTVF